MKIQRIYLLLGITLLAIAPIIARANSNALFQLEIQDTQSINSIVSGGGNAFNNPINSGVYSFSGSAYPHASIDVLQAGEVIAVVTADSAGSFSGSISGLGDGLYSFGFIARDINNNRTTAIMRSFELSSGVSSFSSDSILMPPTVISQKSSVAIGSSNRFEGYAQINASVYIAIEKNGLELGHYEVRSDDGGRYVFELDVKDLEAGVYIAKVFSSAGVYSYVEFSIGEKDLIEKEKRCGMRADLNCDNRVDLVDFSIAAFWYGKELSDSMNEIERLVLNHDSIIDLTDFSIMAYFWTG